jgi:hypothetical protein
LTEGVPVSQARRSALVVAVCFGLLSAWQIYRAHTMLAWIFGVSAVALLVCRMIPVAAVAFHRGWMALAEALGYVNSRILLSLIYYLIIAPTALVLRLIGRDPLDRRGARRSSYWVARPRVEPSRERFERAY